MRFFRLDQWSFENFRIIESYGNVWEIEHYFMDRSELPDWLKLDPPIRFDELDLRFSEKPKSKRIPQIIISAGKLYISIEVYDSILSPLVKETASKFPLKISEMDYYFVRPEVEISCVDTTRSEWRQRDDGYRYSWPRLVLKDVPANAPHLFRPGHGMEFWKQPVFSESLVELCLKNKIVGADFEKVYPLSN
jgi:hypothetical protein